MRPPGFGHWATPLDDELDELEELDEELEDEELEDDELEVLEEALELALLAAEEELLDDEAPSCAPQPASSDGVTTTATAPSSRSKFVFETPMVISRFLYLSSPRHTPPPGTPTKLLLDISLSKTKGVVACLPTRRSRFRPLLTKTLPDTQRV